ncbi:hypothetical protein MK516_04525 [Streptococcus gallolyticus subsp. gallolyticus]|uniref:hypothetical protein n=1 Tax=Streptococcus gallolyticus TaxID=315405 RepID=UPI0022847087|nr:hypothetical protein [Streptococcus gallolyticus]MCY7171785.1 hypothetical protein [Streptococcus gallolyticus subsp. gallolyticus]
MSLGQTLDFLVYLINEIQKEELRDIWLAKDTELSLGEFINKNLHSKRRQGKKQSVEKDKKAIEMAEFILNNDKKGDVDGAI